MRDWSHGSEEDLTVPFRRGPGAGGPDGAGPQGRARLGMGGDHVDRRQDRLHGRNPAAPGPAVGGAGGAGLDGTPAETRERPKALERENRELRRADGISAARRRRIVPGTVKTLGVSYRTRYDWSGVSPAGDQEWGGFSAC